MRKHDLQAEFLAVPVVVGLLGAFFLVFAAAAGGLVWWLVAGAIIVCGLALTAVWAARHGRGAAEERLPGRRPRCTDGVHRVLVIADHPCGSEVRSFTRAHCQRPMEIRVLVPVLASGLSLWTGDERSYGEARTRLNETVAALRAAGIEAEGRLGAEDPLRAADDALSDFAADELLVALGVGNGDRSRDGRDFALRARQRYEIPVSDLG